MKRIDYNSRDSVASVFIPDDDKVFAFVHSRLGHGEEARDAMRRFRSIDQLAIGRGIALSQGYPMDLTEEEKEEARIALAEYMAFAKDVEEHNRFKKAEPSD